MSKNQPMAVPCHDVLFKMACDEPVRRRMTTQGR